MKKKKLLVACSPLDSILITKILGGNFILDRTEDPEDIVKRIKTGSYSLLLVDITFVKPDYKVLKEIRNDAFPVVVLSSEPYDARDEELKRAGCCACYIKPIRQDLFVAFISYWITEYARR